MKVHMTRLENKFQSLIDQNMMVGLSLAIVREGNLIYSQGLGMTGVEDYCLPITPDTLFAIGSISKAIAAATIMRLVEQDILNLDSPIVEYLNDFNFEDSRNGQKVTLRHLLNHSSGLPAGGRNWGLRGHDALSKFVYEDIRFHQFLTPPGKVHNYSSTAISCVGYVAEIVTNTPFDTLVQQLVFEPLDMHRSTFNLAEAMTYPSALPHYLGKDGKLHVIHRQSDNDMGHASSFGFCSTHDLAKFATALFIPGKLLQARSIQEMQMPQISLHVEGANYPGALMKSAFGLGLELGEYRGCRLVGHGGRNQSFNCYMKIFPDQQLAVVLQANYMGNEQPLNVIFELFDVLLKPSSPHHPHEPKTIPYVALDEWVGEYLNPMNGICTVSRNNDRLILDGHQSLICIQKGQYFYRLGGLRFPVTFPYKETMIVHGIPYKQIHRTPFQPDLTLWKSYEGMFIDPFTPYPYESAIHVRFDDGNLWINDVLQDALSNTQFVSSDGLYDFLGNKVIQIHMGTRYIRLS